VEANQIQVRTLALAVATVVCIEAGLAFSSAAFNPVLKLGVARLLELGLMVWIISVQRGGIASIGLDNVQWLSGLKRGVAWSLGFGVLSGILFAVLVTVHINPVAMIRSSLPKSSEELFLFFLVGGIVAPMTEELFFRGILYGFLRRWGIIVALVLSTSAFALIHGLGHGFPITQVVGGLLFASAYEIEKNLLVPITIHCLGNLAIFSVSLIC